MGTISRWYSKLIVAVLLRRKSLNQHRDWRRVKGDYAETLAAYFLRGQGLQLLTRNYACAQGEIDIIMQQGNTLVFIEVRSRQTHDSAAASITPAKQQRIITTATHYLCHKRLLNRSAARFDVITVCQPANERPTIEWLQNAFGID